MLGKEAWDDNETSASGPQLKDVARHRLQILEEMGVQEELTPQAVCREDGRGREVTARANCLGAGCPDLQVAVK